MITLITSLFILFVGYLVIHPEVIPRRFWP